MYNNALKTLFDKKKAFFQPVFSDRILAVKEAVNESTLWGRQNIYEISYSVKNALWEDYMLDPLFLGQTARQMHIAVKKNNKK